MSWIILLEIICLFVRREELGVYSMLYFVIFLSLVSKFLWVLGILYWGVSSEVFDLVFILVYIFLVKVF